jgi:hypothetical protein
MMDWCVRLRYGPMQLWSKPQPVLDSLQTMCISVGNAWRFTPGSSGFKWEAVDLFLCADRVGPRQSSSNLRYLVNQSVVARAQMWKLPLFLAVVSTGNGQKRSIEKRSICLTWQGSTWGNNNVNDATATFTLAEIPGLAAGTTQVTVRDIWNHVDLPDVTGTMTTDLIAPGDSRFFLLTPVTQAK